jgi:hypothetical protein
MGLVPDADETHLSLDLLAPLPVGMGAEREVLVGLLGFLWLAGFTRTWGGSRINLRHGSRSFSAFAWQAAAGANRQLFS